MTLLDILKLLEKRVCEWERQIEDNMSSNLQVKHQNSKYLRNICRYAIMWICTYRLHVDYALLEKDVCISVINASAK